MDLLRRVSSHLGRWPVAIAAVVVLASVVLLPGLGASGLWEPQERQLADRVAPAADLADKAPPDPHRTVAAKDGECRTAAPDDAAARSLTIRAPRWGRDTFGDSDAGRRLPLALMGVLTALAAAGIAMRFGGSRAGVLTAMIALSMPLLVLQSRILTSEIGTACGATLIVYALTALARLELRRGIAIAVLDGLVSVTALASGLALGFYGGGALLGLVVPIGAVAAAGGLGVPLVASAIRRERIWRHAPALLATLGAIALLAVLAYQLYDLQDPGPGIAPPTRSLAGHALVIDHCWSSALGALWRPTDDLRMTFDSTFEQIAYGTFPWGVLAPIAIVGLIQSEDRRDAGALVLAWAGTAWLATEVFQRKVGFTVFAGFPALAIALGVWIDGLLSRRPISDPGGERNGAAGGLILVGLFAAVGVLDLGKDIQSFADRLPSLLIGGDAVPYPTGASMLGVPTKLWVLILGLVVAAAFATTVVVSRAASSRRARTVANQATAVALIGTIAIAAFWAFGWQSDLASHLSSKGMFDTYRALRQSGDQLVIMGDLGQAPHDYADAQFELAPTRTQVVTALGRPNRVFAIAPQTELCSLHREIGAKPYFVVDDRNTRSLLLSNRVDGTDDKNPLAHTLLHTEPTAISHRPHGRVVWEGKIELLGWDVPATMSRGSKAELTLYFKILQPVGATWKVFMHFDGPSSLRFIGDHDPIAGRCPTSTWQPGDFIVDTYAVTAGGPVFPTGKYQVAIGFFTGAAPNWKNMTVSDAPPDMRDPAEQVKITSILLD